jgi:predicted dienelactone hydrolase
MSAVTALRFLLLSLLLAGCGEELPRPEVIPLSAGSEELSRLYKWGLGPLDVRVAPELKLVDPRRDSPLVINVLYPADGRGAFPVVLFSHGNFSDNTDYDRLLSHWVSHGYVVVAPRHADAGGSYLASTVDMFRIGNLGIIQRRYEDLRIALDALPGLEALVPELAGRVDLGRLGAAGHSFGAFNAQQFGGAAPLDVDSGEYQLAPDPRVRAVLAISPPGPMFDEIDSGSWRQQALPTLMTTGTWDTNPVFWPDWQLHRLSFDTSRPGRQYALVVQGADHYFGNLVGRLERGEASQWDALAMANQVAVAFLDAYLKEEAAARAYLDSARLSEVTAGFAVLERR